MATGNRKPRAPKPHRSSGKMSNKSDGSNPCGLLVLLVALSVPVAIGQLWAFVEGVLF